MGIADRIHELVKGLPDPEAGRILRFVENVHGRRVPVAPAQRQVNLALFRQYRGRYDCVKIEREALYTAVPAFADTKVVCAFARGEANIAPASFRGAPGSHRIDRRRTMVG